MICKECGAVYADNLTQCPYCQAENIQAAYEKQQEYIHDLKRKAHKVSNLPEEMANKTTHFFGKAVVIGAIAFVIVLIVGLLGAKITGSMQLARQERELARLEEYYSAGDYAKLEEYYRSLEHTNGGSYEKYDRTVYVFWYVTSTCDSLEAFSDVATYYTKSDIEGLIEDVVKVLNRIHIYKTEGFLYGEEQAMLEFEAQLRAAATEHLKLTDEELDVLVEQYSKEEDINCSKEAELVIERLGGK